MELFFTLLTTTFGEVYVTADTGIVLRIDGDVMSMTREATMDLISQIETGAEARVKATHLRTSYLVTVTVRSNATPGPWRVQATRTGWETSRDISRGELLGALRAAAAHAGKVLALTN